MSYLTAQRTDDRKTVRVMGQVGVVSLNQGLVALIDAEDAQRVSGRVWTLRRSSRTSYVYATIDGRAISLHRFVSVARQGVEIDHVNGDGLDNRRCNLRVATRSQNACNARRKLRSIAPYRGIHFRKDRKRWSARIKLGGKSYYLGLYDSAEAAHAAYCEAAKRLHGEFARFY